MARLKDLGLVVKVFASGIVETNKGVKSLVKAEIGDKLVQDIQTKEIKIAPKKSKVNGGAKDDDNEVGEDNNGGEKQ